MRKTIIMLALLSGCTTQTESLYSAIKADQDNAMSVATAAGDPALQLCVKKLDAMAQVDCTVTINGKTAPGPACVLAKTYEVNQSITNECAAVEANAKSSFLKILSAIGLTP